MVRTDLPHRGRWISLRLGGREWLWHRSDPARDSAGRVFDLATAGPGDAAVIPAAGVCAWRLEFS